MKRLFFGALLLCFTSLAACSSNSNESNSTESRESAEGAPASTTDPSQAPTLDTVVVDTNVRGNP